LAREAWHAALALSPRLPELVDVGWLTLEGATARPCSARAGGQPCIALAWVDGADLLQARPGDATQLQGALPIARDLGDALADLHAVGLAHGDVKPANVLRDRSGRAHLVDLGLACPIHESEVRGATPRYLARADSNLGDARARDLAALGVLLAELV